MTMDKSCPGSRTIREPRPEYMDCPKCGKEVEIWTDELKATCRSCGSKVYRAQQASCIEWCPHAKECVGPEVYERLMAGGGELLAEDDNPIDILVKEHDRAQERIALLRAASLCLKLGAAQSGSAVWDKGVDHLARVIEFIDKDIALHFHREESVLFPLLERHLAQEKSPMLLLLGEHDEFWTLIARLKEQLEQLRAVPASEELAARVQDVSAKVERLLLEHIKKENESLVPLAKGLLKGAELEEFSQQWKTTSLEEAKV